MKTTYEQLQARGIVFCNAPRANPDDKLDQPYVLRRGRWGRIVMRAETRDALETKAHRALNAGRL